MAEEIEKVESVIESLLRLQELDCLLDEMEEKAEQLPLRIELARGKLDREKEALVSLKKLLENTKKERKLLELDLQSKNDQLKKFLEQQWSIKSNEAYAALSEEIKRVKAEIDELEEKVLEIIYKEDKTNTDIKEKTEALRLLENETEEIQKEVKEEDEALEHKIEEFENEREEIAKNMESVALSRYEHLREKKGGMVIALVENDICKGCNMDVPYQVQLEIKKGEGFIYCQSCGRIIYIAKSKESEESIE